MPCKAGFRAGCGLSTCDENDKIAAMAVAPLSVCKSNAESSATIPFALALADA